MTLWMLILIGSSVLILIGVLIDFIAKKKGLRVDPDEGLKNSCGSERIYSEALLQQTVCNNIDPNS